MISVQNISKSFLIPHAQRRSVRDSLFSFFQTKHYERIDVLKDFSLDVKRGEFVGIMGSNGSGKSTLLKMVAGIYQPDTGEIRLAGKTAAILELGVGFHPDLSARDNVFLNGSLLGISQQQLKKSFRDIFAFAGLEQFVEAPLKHFSSGMAARLAFAIVSHVDAEIYLLDEVLAVGDQEFQQKCLKVFEQWKEKGKTVLLVSHAEELLKRVCDRIITIQ